MSASNPTAWDAETLYSVGDRVTHDEDIWEATLQSRNAEPNESSTYWTLVDSGNGSENNSTWNQSTLYEVGDTIRHNGSTWRAVIASRNAEPNQGSPYWSQKSASRDESGNIVVRGDESKDLAEQIESLNADIPDNHTFNDAALEQLKLRVRLLEQQLRGE